MTSSQTQAVLHNYYGTLLDIVLIVAFLVALKLAMVYFMAIMSRWVDENAASSAAQAKAAKAARVKEPLSRTILWYGLGVAWLVNGILQMRANIVIASKSSLLHQPAFYAQPPWVHHLLQMTIDAFAAHPIRNNIWSVFIQLIIGSAILVGKDKIWGKGGLWLSILWSVFIWAFGEGFGRLFSGSPSYLHGSPGAAVFFVFAAVILLFSPDGWEGRLPAVNRRMILAYWFIGGLWQLVPVAGHWTKPAIAGLLQYSLHGPRTHALDPSTLFWSQQLAGSGVIWNAVFAFVPILLAVIGWKRRTTWLGVVLTLWTLFVWWIGQSLSAPEQTGIDLNAGIALALVTVSSWLWTASRR
ncbi:hypothetical protein [Alicyclobacillus sp. SO9]|uniref:hypothetical protein n=1 Tax=Alicyclobacillus sp. SO9 TaxID=2665646 RepID=UPI0018E7BC9B|nr:hypothetical protein [Alicyclobacillus sp. SO9]QQE77489.1 hypothetical protein GI364_16275 [Alicyclobacillus sp. SO9]